MVWVMLYGHGNGGLLNREGFWKEVTLYILLNKNFNFHGRKSFQKKGFIRQLLAEKKKKDDPVLGREV